MFVTSRIYKNSTVIYLLLLGKLSFLLSKKVVHIDRKYALTVYFPIIIIYCIDHIFDLVNLISVYIWISTSVNCGQIFRSKSKFVYDYITLLFHRILEKSNICKQLFVGIRTEINFLCGHKISPIIHKQRFTLVSLLT